MTVITVTRDDTAAEALIAEMRGLLDELRAERGALRDERRAGHELLTDLRAAVKSAGDALARITSGLSTHIEAELLRIMKSCQAQLTADVERIAADVRRKFQGVARGWLASMEDVLRGIGDGSFGAIVLSEQPPFFPDAARPPGGRKRGGR